MAGRLPILPPTIQTAHLYAAHIAKWNICTSRMAVIRSSLLKVRIKKEGNDYELQSTVHSHNWTSFIEKRRGTIYCAVLII